MTDTLDYSQVMPLLELPIQSNLHLLIVEDVIADVELMVLFLEAAEINFTYDTTDTLSYCQQLLQTKTYDAVLADYRLPQFTAYQVLKLLQQSGQEIPLILVTGSLGEEAAVECIKAGMTDYVMKERLLRLPIVLARSLEEFVLRRQKQAAIAQIQRQAQQEAVINRIIQAMRETLDLDDMLQTTVDTLHEALSVNRCLIFQPHNKGEMWIYHVSQATTARQSLIGIKCSLYTHYKETLNRGELVVIDKISASLPLEIQTIAKECEIGALIIAPLLYQQSYLGGIILHQCDHERQWTIDEISLVKAISHQCAIAIHQAKLFRQVQQQALKESIINRIVQAMHETLVLDEVLQTTADQLHQALNVTRCLIFQPDAQGQMNVHYVSTATPEQKQLIGMLCVLMNHYQNELAQGSQIALGHINQIVPPETELIAKQFGVRAILMTPLIYQQQYIGGICLHQCHEREWTTDEISLVKAISDQCAIAIHQAKLFRQVQQQAAREQTLNQISRAISSSLDPAHILQEIVQLTGECFSVDRVLIFTTIAEQIQVINEWRADEQVISMVDFKAPISGWPDLLDPDSDFCNRRAFHAPNYGNIPITATRQEQIQQMQTYSVLCAPIFILDQLFGGIALNTTKTYRTFTTDEIHLLEQIGAWAAIALYNAQSYEHLENLVQQRTQELEKEKLLSDAANRAKSEFLSNMSHELRTPLTGILGFSSLIKDQIFGPLNAKQKQYIEGIHVSGKHLLDLINDLLDLSKVEAGQEDLNLEQISVDELTRTCMSLIEERARSRDLQLALMIAPDVVTCIADQRRLKQILVNLLSNAVKFTESGSITLKVTQTADEIKFSVIDTGIGITKADQATLFQPFRQLDSGLNRKYEGTGLGLVLSRKLARLHGGDITINSKLGCGSCFTLHLPLAVSSK